MHRCHLQRKIRHHSQRKSCWHWHWPALTTIRVVPLNSHTYHIREHVRRSEHDLSDEPVVAATKDLGLVSLEGEITFQLVENSPAILAARISPKSISRTIRPIIRQCFRLAIAEYRKTSLKPSNTLNKQISEMLTDSMADYAIQLHSVSINRIRPFSPVHTPSRRPNTQREGGDTKTLPG